MTGPGADPIARKPLPLGLRLGAGLVLWLCWAGGTGVRGGEPAADAKSRPPGFRLAFTSGMFTEVNESDARAAMKVWILTVGKERSIPVDPDPNIYATAEDLAQASKTNQWDGIALLTPEYLRLSRELTFDRFAVGVRGGEIAEEYVVLVRQQSGIERIEQLQGLTLNVLQNPRTSMALIWLDTLLLQAHLKRAREFFDRVTLVNKASLVALPVFFGKVDACLMTRNSFEVMGELNPQLGKQMRVIATSPEVVPSGFAFRPGNQSRFRAQTLAEMVRLGETAAGKQVLALTQADRIEDRPVSCLDRTLELLNEHARLCGGTNQAAAATSSLPAGRAGGGGD